MTRVIFALLGFVVAAGAVYGAWSVMSQSHPVEAAVVRRESIRQYVDEQAMTRLPETFDVRMPYAGRVERVERRVGETVHQGDVLARIVSEDLQNDLAEAQAVVDRLQATLAEKQSVTVETTAKRQAANFVEATAHTVESLKAQLESARRQLEYAESFLSDMRRLAATGAETEDALERAEVEYVRSRSDVAQTTQNLEGSEAMLAGMTLLPQLIQDYIDRKSLEARSVNEQLAEARARLRQVELRVERGVMTSPIDGVILERPVYSEQFLDAGTLLMEIGDLSDVEVEADLLSQEVVAVHSDDPVEIYGSTVGGELGHGLEGFVQRIYPQAFTKVSSLGVEQQRVKTIVRFKPAAQARAVELHLGVDYRVRVRIFTDEKSGALVVPRSSLFQSPDGDWQVFVIHDGRATVQGVEVGILNDQAAEITAGLTEGQSVIVAPESELRAGMRVRASNGG
ncbi:MAG: HlyD family efflux transporter periplasmic adaptor subunit [Planctomycetales bacterium]|nr:HlyD family efflux transporter periplasmic adaptor subunit [Planctomycetales bacterium]